MKFSCEKCGANYLLPDEKIGERGVRVRCKRCEHINTVQRTIGRVATDSIEEQALGSLELGVSGVDGQRDVDFQSASNAQMDAMFDSIFQPGQTQQALALGESTSEPKARALEPAPPLVQSNERAEPEPEVQSESEPETKPERDWWVAIDNQQVGPLAVDEVQQRVDAGVIMATTLVWRSGMEGWDILESQAELKSLLPKVSPKVVLQSAVDHEEVETEIRLGGGAEEPRVAWRPSAAIELSELVKAEFEEVVTPESGPDISAAAGMEVPTFTAPTGGTGFDKGSGSSLPTMALLLVLVAGGGALAWQKLQVEPGLLVEPSVATAAEVSKPAAVVAEKPAEDPLALTEIPTSPAVDTDAKEAAEPAVVEKLPTQKITASAKSASTAAEKKKASKSVAKKSSSKSPTASKPARKSSKKSAKKSGGGALDGVFDSKAPLQSRLSQKAITDGFRKNSTSLRPCIRNAISNREVTPGRHTLELSFDILPNGKVSGSRMAGPYYLQGTSLPKCLVAAMRGWRFGKSREGNKVEKQRLPFKFNPGS